MRGPQAGAADSPRPPRRGPRPGAKSAAQLAFAFASCGPRRAPAAAATAALATRPGRPACLGTPAPRPPYRGLRPARAPARRCPPCGRSHPGRACRQPRSFLPSARPSERRRPAGSLKRRRLLSPPPPRRSLPLCSLRRSLHVKPPEWSQGEVGNAATYGRAGRSAPAQRLVRRRGPPS